MKNKKRILICPLDWGLGHATRCIPIIRELEKKGAEVLVAADKRPFALLKKEFPHLQFIRFPGYEISYSRKNLVLKICFALPRLLWGIYQEHQQLKKIIKAYKINAVISDNRYGLWNKHIPSVFITHQIMVKCPVYLKFLEPILYLLNCFFINKYNECWIPDVEGEKNFSGDLSHRYPLPNKRTYYIGSLSRFTSPITNHQSLITSYDLLVILSGPEPQRSILEKKIITQLNEMSLKTLIVKGTPESNEYEKISDMITSVSHLESEKMQTAILSSAMILSRAGYSTVMDLVTLGKKAIFIPTPGQTEQEYLARYYEVEKIFYSEPQCSFDLKRALKKTENYSGTMITDSKLNLKRVEVLCEM